MGLGAGVGGAQAQVVFAARALHHHGLGVAEAPEAVEAMVRAGAGGADAAKRHALDGGVGHDVVDHQRAGGGEVGKALLARGVGAEVVGGQRARMVVDVGQGLVGLGVGFERQDGAEDLFLHHAHGVGGAQHQGRGHLAGGGVRQGLASGLQLDHGGTLGAGVVQQGLQTLEVALADDGGVVGVGVQRGEHARHEGAGVRHEGVLRAGGQHHIVGRDADLAGVEGFDGEDALGGGLQVGIGVDQHGGLAAQLQRDRHEVFGGGAHDLAPHVGAAGEDEVVKGLAAEGGAHAGIAQHGADFHRVEVAGDELAHQRRGARGELGRLDERAVAGGQHPGQRAEGQVDGEVPGADDADHAQGLVLDTRLHAGGRGGLFFGLHPLRELLAGVAQGAQGRHDVGGQGLVGGAVAEVGVDGVDQLAVVGAQQRHGAAEAILTEFGAGGAVLDVGALHGGDGGGQAGGGDRGAQGRVSRGVLGRFCATGLTQPGWLCVRWGYASPLSRGVARPALKRPVEGAELGKAQAVRNVVQRLGGVAEQLQGEVAARVVKDVKVGRVQRVQASRQGAFAQVEGLGRFGAGGWGWPHARANPGVERFVEGLALRQGMQLGGGVLFVQLRQLGVGLRQSVVEHLVGNEQATVGLVELDRAAEHLPVALQGADLFVAEAHQMRTDGVVRDPLGGADHGGQHGLDLVWAEGQVALAGVVHQPARLGAAQHLEPTAIRDQGLVLLDDVERLTQVGSRLQNEADDVEAGRPDQGARLEAECGVV